MPKAASKLPSAEYLHQCFEYEAVSGALRWRHRPVEHFKNVRASIAWNAKHVGEPVGSLLSSGYLHTSLGRRKFYLSRIIYKMHCGTDPQIVDHIDRNQANNRIENLRSVNSQQSRQNAIKPSRRGGLAGISPMPNGSYRAHIKDGPKMRHIGVFASAEAAHSAYRAASIAAFGEFSPFHSTLSQNTVATDRPSAVETSAGPRRNISSSVPKGSGHTK